MTIAALAVIRPITASLGILIKAISFAYVYSRVHLINVIKKYSRRDKIFKIFARSTQPPPEICGALAL